MAGFQKNLGWLAGLLCAAVTEWTPSEISGTDFYGQNTSPYSVKAMKKIQGTERNQKLITC